MEIKELKTEYQYNPIGVDRIPRFSWKMSSDKNETVQTAYQVIVSSGGLITWDSGVMVSDQSILINYKGSSLEPMTEYSVRVTVWDNHEQSTFAEGIFETGLMSQEQWNAQWITHSFDVEETACPVFSKQFTTKKTEVRKARAYVTSCGVYELGINGKKVGEDFFAPGWTSYHKRLQYQTYDITKLLSKENEIQITVGSGWYKGYLNCEGEKDFYGDRTAVLAMICVEYEDGTKQTLGTDMAWKVSTSIIQSSEIYHGEVQDYTELTDELTREKAVLFDTSDIISDIVAQECEPVRITRRFPVVEKIITPKGEVVLDFGQNMAGVVEIQLPPLNGERLVIMHAETLDREGNFYTENLRSARCTDQYIYTEKQIDMKVMPHFTYHGFRYIKVEGAGEKLDIRRFTACAMHTDMEKSGSFYCNNKLINQLQSNIEWGQRSNFFDIPTDCPQRDERLGWTGDAQIFCKTAMFNFHSVRFYQKYMHDIAAETDDDHGVPHQVPNITGPATGTAIWSDCASIIPWTAYMVYGDKGILEEQYNNMQQWVEYVNRSCGENVLWMNGFQRGDWLSLDGDASLNPMSGGTDKNLIANIYYAYSVRILSDAAKVLGKKNDFSKYDTRYKSIVSEINEEFITKNGRIVTETQTACTLLLYFDIIKEEHRQKIVETLKQNLIEHKGHLTTGFVGTAYLCHVLTENKLHNLAEDVILTEEYPGWLYAVKKGATTIWERWNSVLSDGRFDESGMNSLNHYSFGSVGDWLYQKVAGINLMAPGYKKILICPQLTRSITKMEATYECPYGTIKSAWSCSGGRITVDVTIPVNTKAILKLPEQENEIELGSGNYHYEYETDVYLESGNFSMHSTIGEILDAVHGKELLDKYFPGITSHPMLGYIRNRTLFNMEASRKERNISWRSLLMELNQYN